MKLKNIFWFCWIINFFIWLIMFINKNIDGLIINLITLNLFLFINIFISDDTYIFKKKDINELNIKDLRKIKLKN